MSPCVVDTCLIYLQHCVILRTILAGLIKNVARTHTCWEMQPGTTRLQAELLLGAWWFAEFEIMWFPNGYRFLLLSHDQWVPTPLFTTFLHWSWDNISLHSDVYFLLRLGLLYSAANNLEFSLQAQIVSQLKSNVILGDNKAHHAINISNIATYTLSLYSMYKAPSN